MNTKWIYALFGLLVLGSVVFAIGGATAGTQSYYDRWYATATGTGVVEGGNISDMNLTSSSLTDRWAAFFGNVSGTLVLRDATNDTALVYSWSSWDPANGGEVCASTDGTFAFTTAAAATGANVNADFVLGTAADNATNTYNDAYACGLVFDGTPAVAVSAGVDHTDGSFWTCAISDGATGSKDNYAFCTEINSTGVNFKNWPAHYEIMVPTEPGTGTETYYFYAELG